MVARVFVQDQPVSAREFHLVSGSPNRVLLTYILRAHTISQPKCIRLQGCSNSLTVDLPYHTYPSSISFISIDLLFTFDRYFLLLLSFIFRQYSIHTY